jgi:N4-(beta-N-acetylglucosaminyl)-L-asparaginase
MPDGLNRREFVSLAAGAAAGLAAGSAHAQPAPTRTTTRVQDAPRAGGNMIDPVVIASGNGLATVARAREMIVGGADPLDAIVEGVAIVENDPEDMTVGLGGLPNEEGVVTLDSCCMHGPMHRAGAVAHLVNIKNPAQVAREVARRTDHVLLVGEGALKFAKRLGFQEENLLTEKARQAWLRWRANLSDDDDWLGRDEWDLPTAPPKGMDWERREQSRVDDALDRELRELFFTYGTIHCSAVTASGDLAGCTTTSGLSWKLPGRVGDSPIIGAGCYTDNAMGSAGATGRGEAVIQICGAHTITTLMGAGRHPKDACIEALRMIAERTRVPRLLDEQGRPNFYVVFYAVDKQGRYGSAAMYGGRQFAVADQNGARLEECAYLYEA